MTEVFGREEGGLLVLSVDDYVKSSNLNKQGRKNLITQYEQLMGTALLKNEAKGPGKGEFKKLPIYGRNGNLYLEKQLNDGTLDNPQYLKKLKEYHNSMKGEFGKIKKGDVANISKSQLQKLQKLITPVLPTGGTSGLGGVSRPGDKPTPLTQMCAMGFPEEGAAAALAACDDNVAVAVGMLTQESMGGANFGGGGRYKKRRTKKRRTKKRS